MFKYDSATSHPMATLDWQLRRTGEVTLVELSVRSDRDRRVRIESRLRPVWPPRRQGVPVEGWQDDAFEGTVEGGNPLVLGYATPAPPTEPPAEIADTGPPGDDEEPTPRTLVRTLGDARPPRDALPDASAPVEGAGGRAAPIEGGSETTGTEPAPSPTDHSMPAGDCRTTDQPAAVTEWFESVESRLATTRQLADATDADEIRDAVEAAGGIEAVRSLQAQLDADRRQLAEFRRRSETLADRLSAAELPLATLERVV